MLAVRVAELFQAARGSQAPSVMSEEGSCRGAVRSVQAAADDHRTTIGSQMGHRCATTREHRASPPSKPNVWTHIWPRIWRGIWAYGAHALAGGAETSMHEMSSRPLHCLRMLDLLHLNLRRTSGERVWRELVLAASVRRACGVGVWDGCVGWMNGMDV